MTPTSEGPRLGVFGGTFDPIHLGHLEVAEDCARKLDLDPVLMVPSNLPPHRAQPRASAQDRMAMVQLAVIGYQRLRASDLEVRRGGVSYTVDTIRALRQEYPAAEITLLLGWDAVEEFAGWRDTAEVTRLARIAVFNRAGSPAPDRTILDELGLPPDTAVLEVASPAVSATSVRRLLAEARPGAAVLPPAVEEYIRENGLYRE
ncbi:MAG TPA: nicotinate-nucleotide adenylyltransferase [Candidatus Dormibacteraeota bacterium]|nr:nicotinate-nucleotide adenylyltransferase [Candidatus Dormibacteraeota bacterium]